MVEDTSRDDGEGVEALDAVAAQVALGHPVIDQNRCLRLEWLLGSNFKVSNNNESVM